MLGLGDITKDLWKMQFIDALTGPVFRINQEAHSCRKVLYKHMMAQTRRACHHAYGTVQPSARKRPPAGGSSAAPLAPRGSQERSIFRGLKYLDDQICRRPQIKPIEISVWDRKCGESKLAGWASICS